MTVCKSRFKPRYLLRDSLYYQKIIFLQKRTNEDVLLTFASNAVTIFLLFSHAFFFSDDIDF